MSDIPNPSWNWSEQSRVYPNLLVHVYPFTKPQSEWTDEDKKLVAMLQNGMQNQQSVR